MIKWLLGKFSSNEGECEEPADDYAVSSAKRIREIAEEEHQEVMELIELLAIENKKNHYAQLVESALKARRAER